MTKAHPSLEFCTVIGKPSSFIHTRNSTSLTDATALMRIVRNPFSKWNDIDIHRLLYCGSGLACILILMILS